MLRVYYHLINFVIFLNIRFLNLIESRRNMKSIKGYLYGVTLYREEPYIGELLIMNNMRCYFGKIIRVRHIGNTITGRIDYKKDLNIGENRFALY